MPGLKPRSPLTQPDSNLGKAGLKGTLSGCSNAEEGRSLHLEKPDNSSCLVQSRVRSQSGGTPGQLQVQAPDLCP